MFDFQGKPLLAITGPTGTGKSELAVRIARQSGGEIVNADSRQVYLSMNIGTAKPSVSEFSAAKHHLYDMVSPDEEFSVAHYKELALGTISNILERGKLPILVGGSGQYVWSVIEGWEIPRVAPDLEYRKHLEEFAEEHGIDELYRRLEEVDPPAASKIDKRNVRRVIRALEVTRQSGKPISELQTKNPPGFNTVIIGLTAARERLYERVDARVDKMIDNGLVDEVISLKKAGYDEKLPSMNTIGYSQILAMLSGEMTLEEAAEKIKNDTHRFIRHQYAWFRLKDPRINWFDIGNMDYAEVERLVKTLV